MILRFNVLSEADSNLDFCNPCLTLKVRIVNLRVHTLRWLMENSIHITDQLSTDSATVQEKSTSHLD